MAKIKTGKLAKMKSPKMKVGKAPKASKFASLEQKFKAQGAFMPKAYAEMVGRRMNSVKGMAPMTKTLSTKGY